jgi:carbon storage regulator
MSIMLVLSRKKNESIVIDESIVITVVEIRGDKVRLGIEAPRDVSIHRNEVFELIQNQITETVVPEQSELSSLLFDGILRLALNPPPYPTPSNPCAGFRRPSQVTMDASRRSRFRHLV